VSDIDKIIEELRIELEPIQECQNRKSKMPVSPIGLIVGVPRSGTTLLLQYLASSNFFSYPSNLLAKFPFSPWLGMQISRLLLPSSINNNIDFFSSTLGKSAGLDGVNEFYHFWRRFVPKYFPGFLSKEELEDIDIHRILLELATIEDASNKPFVCKGMMFQYNLEFLTTYQKYFIFLRIKRNPEYVMQSIYMARKKYNNNDLSKWWSVKPREYSSLIDKDVYHQIAGQVFFTERSLDVGLSRLISKNVISITYEDLCRYPMDIIEKTIKAFKKEATPFQIPSLPSFSPANNIQIEDEHFQSLKKAYGYFVQTVK